MRCAVYARFSTDLQNERSVEDQEHLCAEYIGQHGYTLVRTYTDKGISGASIHNRPGLQALLKSAKDGQLDAIVMEDFNRFSRNAGDLLKLHEQLTLHQVRLISVSSGEADTMTLGLHGIVGQAQRETTIRNIR